MPGHLDNSWAGRYLGIYVQIFKINIHFILVPSPASCLPFFGLKYSWSPTLPSLSRTPMLAATEKSNLIQGFSWDYVFSLRCWPMSSRLGVIMMVLVPAPKTVWGSRGVALKHKNPRQSRQWAAEQWAAPDLTRAHRTHCLLSVPVDD